MSLQLVGYVMVIVMACSVAAYCLIELAWPSIEPEQ